MEKSSHSRESRSLLQSSKHHASSLEELTWLVSHENGKTYAESKAEVLKAIECVEFGCSLPNLAAGEQLDVSRGVNVKLFTSLSNCRRDYTI